MHCNRLTLGFDLTLTQTNKVLILQLPAFRLLKFVSLNCRTLMVICLQIMHLDPGVADEVMLLGGLSSASASLQQVHMAQEGTKS